MQDLIFLNKPIPNIGDHVVLPYKDENGNDNFKMVKVISYRFWVDGGLADDPIQDRVYMVVSDPDSVPESRFRD